MGICAGKPATKTSEDPNSQVEPVENGYQVHLLTFMFVLFYNIGNKTSLFVFYEKIIARNMTVHHQYLISCKRHLRTPTQKKSPTKWEE